MEDPNLSSPITFSGSGGGGPDDAFLVSDPNGSQIGSASGSFQNEGFLSASAGGGGAADGGNGNSSDAEFGFQRAEFGQGSLVRTVQIYDRHVFLCYKTPKVWPPHVEAAEFDRLPRLLSASLAARKGDMKKKTRLTICEGEDGTESSNGDVLIFPDMVRYRQLTHFDVDNFVEEVLVKDTEWLPGAVETLTGSYVFVCSHGSRDRRCGVCGPVLINKFEEEIKSRGLQGQVSVSPCSHIGGHKYAGNVIIFSQNVDGEVTGHWYGYVGPDDVPVLLEQHIGKGEVVAHLWRFYASVRFCLFVSLSLPSSPLPSTSSRRQLCCMPPPPNIHFRVSACARFYVPVRALLSLRFSFTVELSTAEHLLQQTLLRLRLLSPSRGQMGLSEEDQKKAHELRLQLNGETEREQNAKESTQVGELDGVVNGTINGAAGCCQGIGNSTCCQNQAPEGKLDPHQAGKLETVAKKNSKDTKGTSTRKACAGVTWFQSWEREDTYATIAVVAAVLSVAVAYGCYRQMR